VVKKIILYINLSIIIVCILCIKKLTKSLSHRFVFIFHARVSSFRWTVYRYGIVFICFIYKRCFSYDMTLFFIGQYNWHLCLFSIAAVNKMKYSWYKHVFLNNYLLPKCRTITFILSISSDLLILSQRWLIWEI
jgi:hypothetical protein